MTKKICLCFAIAAMLSVVATSDAQAFWGSRGSWGSCGSSGGNGGSSGSSGSWGSSGSHGGILSRIFNGSRGSHGSSGSHGGYSSCGSNGGHSYSSAGSAGGAVYYSSGGYHTSTQPSTTHAVAAQAPAVKTQLTLRVPAGAKVTLAGVQTKQTGEVRQFTTTRLANGQAWQNYQVVVEMDKNGKLVREERTITLTGGVPQELAIGVADVTTLAQATR
jgi:uncharacterized protein (TIGR03000 family)